MEIEKNILPEDDSDTDYDCDEDDSSSSDDEENFTSKFGNAKTKTSCQGKVQVKQKKQEEKADAEEDEEMDDFEAEMERELAQRVFEAETKAAIANVHARPRLTEEEKDLEMDEDDLNSPSGSKSRKEEENSDKYEDIYFDSDEEDGDQRKRVTNDDLFYDPNQDADDQKWVDEVRQSYQMSAPGDSVQKLPNSDAVLNCPACFAVLCLDCQRHEIYRTQYRAMFVMNCSVKTDTKMKFPVKFKGGRKKKAAFPDSDEFYNPVTCDTCNTEVAMYDKDEIYHFFNVVASHT